MNAQPTGISAPLPRLSPARMRRSSAPRRSHDQRRRRSARRGIPPPARAPTTSASRIVLTNIIRGQSGARLLRRRGHVSWYGLMKHGRQLVGTVGRPIQDGPVQTHEDRDDLWVKLDAGEALELVDGLLVREWNL